MTRVCGRVFYHQSKLSVDWNRLVRKNIMFIIAQIPFVDFRLLSSEKDKYNDCFFPNTFNKVTYKPIYYRFFGEEKNRYSPNQLPISERQFFNAHRAIHINSQAFVGDGFYHPILLFSRLFEEAQFFHFDIGIRETFKNNFNRRDFNHFINEFLKSPFFEVNGKYDTTNKQYTFIELVEQIKQMYLYATKSKQVEERNNNFSQIVLGYPALFVTYDKNEIHSFGNAKEVKINNGIKVRYNMIPINHTFVSVWFIGKNDISKYNQELRNLRIYLSKLHVYKEATRLILDNLKYNIGNELDMHKVITFFEYILSLIEREKYYGYNNTDFWKIVFDIDNIYNNVNWNEYRYYINAKIQEVSTMSSKNNTIIVKNSTIKGSIVNDSTNIQINSEKQNKIEESINNFDNILNELLNNSQLTNQQMESLNDQINNFKEYIKNDSSQKGFASKLLNSIKNTFNCMIANSDGIQKLMAAGESIINLLK